MSDVKRAVEIIRKALPDFQAKIAVVLGSGLGAVANLMHEKASIPYTDLPGFPQPTVAGHEGTMQLGHVDDIPVIFMKGRVHLYEGVGVESLKTMVRTLKALEIDALFLTNAAGSTNPEWGPGSLVAVKDHLNLTGTNPLAGPNDDEWGPRFPPMSNAWDADLRSLLIQEGIAADITLGEGVFGGFLGPTFETPAEVQMAKILGADTVGMSMVAENIVANHCGLKCVGCSAITNLAEGLNDEPLSHEQTLEGAKLAEKKMARLIRAFITAYERTQQSAAA